MLRTLKIGVALALACALSLPVKADPPPESVVMSVNRPMVIVCDTSGQIAGIGEGYIEGGAERAMEVMRPLYEAINGRNEHTCIIFQLLQGTIVFHESIFIGVAKLGDKAFRLWATRYGRPQRDITYWMLWSEAIAPAPAGWNI